MKLGQNSLLITLAIVASGILAGFAIAQSNTSAPDNTTGEAGIGGFWEVILPGGKFMCSLNTITSISQHEYILDGSARVYEVTIDTSGNVTARFYFLEPITSSLGESPLSIGQNAGDRAKEVMDRVTNRTGTSEIVWKSVVKNYPTTTHAKTTEFRLQYKENLETIYKHVHRAWAEKDREKSFLLKITDE